MIGLKRKYRLQRIPAGTVEFGDLRRTKPISAMYGRDRGLPIDRYYIEGFLAKNQSDIKGRTLEIGSAFYTKKFGGGRVTKMDVLHYVEGNAEATIVGDLTHAPHIASDTFDCIICTQTLQMIVDMQAALRTCYRILNPDGVLLLTSAGISRVGRRLGEDDWGEYWHLTTQGAAQLFEQTFPGCELAIGSYGNVLAATAFLHGLATDELSSQELDVIDEAFEMLVTVRARKII